MKKLALIFSLLVAVVFCLANSGLVEYFGPGLCKDSKFHCITVNSNDTWEKLFPNENERDLVQRINRFDTSLDQGSKKTLAVPKDIKTATLFEYSPFPLHIKPLNKKLIIVDQSRLAWASYDSNGKLVRWGPTSTGRDYCEDIHGQCRTITGMFNIFVKKGPKCRSNIFPVGKGGSDMPYCMFFYKGYALHGSDEVYGRRASHGCVRLFTRDAKWLNENFVDVNTKEGAIGTKIVIQNLTNKELEDGKHTKSD